jgi:diguanylate cyclase (GGDEF)-like protein/PAS domain S-box-containing protein
MEYDKTSSANKVSSGIKSSVKAILILLAIALCSEFIFIIYLLRSFDNQFWSWKRDELVRITDTAVSAIIHDIRDHNEDSQEARLQKVIATVNDINYRDTNGTNYFFLCSYNGTFLAHPYSKTLIGKTPSDLPFYGENNFIKQLTKAAANESGSGFTQYSIVSPNNTVTGQKLSYVRRINEINAFIGTGLYIDGAKKQQRVLFNIIGIASLGILLLIFSVIFAVLFHLRKILARLNLSNYRFGATFNGIDHFICILDTKYKLIDANEHALKFIGKDISDVLGLPFRDTPWWTDNINSRPVLAEAQRAYERNVHMRYEVTINDKDGDEHILSFSIYPVSAKGKKQHLIIAEGVNITSLKKKESEIYRLAYYDRISSLPNERLMDWNFEQMKDETGWDKSILALIEAGNLSLINNLLGLEAGDDMVRSLSLLLQEYFPKEKNIILGRITGSVFTICMPYSEKERMIERLKKLKARMNDSILFGEYSAHVIMYIGIAEYPEHGKTFPELVKNAASAKDESKLLPGSVYNFFDKSMTDRMSNSLFIQESLRSPLLSNELSVHFQPQVSLSDNRIVGYEALVRWNHPQKGSIPPSTFIPIAESEGMISKIGDFVASEVCRFLTKTSNPGGVKISINVSVVQLLDGGFPASLAKMLREWNITPEMVPLEITESVLIKSFDSVLPTLELLSKRGHEIHLDDFGSGFSSLTYFTKLPITVLKLDKSFIDQISTEKKTRDIVKGIIQMAHSQNMQVIAEGVEHQEDADILTELGCDTVQGWLTGKPLNFENALISINGITANFIS